MDRFRGFRQPGTGSALFTSTKTASIHVSNILAKLGVSGGGRRRSRRTTSDWSRSELTGPRTLVGVNWKVAIALGAAVGGVVYAVLRKNRTAAADAELWAEATDPL